MGALVLVRRCLARPYRAAFVGGGFLPRALPWAGLARTVGAQNNLRPLRSVADAASVRVPQRKMHRPRPLPSLPSNSCPLRACLDGTGPPHYVPASRDPYVVQRPKSTEASSVGAQKSSRPLLNSSFPSLPSIYSLLSPLNSLAVTRTPKSRNSFCFCLNHSEGSLISAGIAPNTCVGPTTGPV